MHSQLDLINSFRAHSRLFDSSFLFTILHYNMQILNKTLFAYFLTMAMLVGSASSIHTTATAAKLRRTDHTTEADMIKPVGGGPGTDGGINKKTKSKKNSPAPSAFPSIMPSAQPTQKKSGKGMMSLPPPLKPSY
jgi:hypothetical protein